MEGNITLESYGKETHLKPHGMTQILAHLICCEAEKFASSVPDLSVKYVFVLFCFVFNFKAREGLYYPHVFNIKYNTLYTKRPTNLYTCRCIFFAKIRIIFIKIRLTCIKNSKTNILIRISIWIFKWSNHCITSFQNEETIVQDHIKCFIVFLLYLA